MKPDSSMLIGQEESHPRETTINKLFEILIGKNDIISSKVALIHSETKFKVTFKELNEQANRLARYLLTKIETDELLPNSDGDYIVAVRFQPDHSLIITLLALFKAGLA